jgi:hypothetical protein
LWAWEGGEAALLAEERRVLIEGEQSCGQSGDVLSDEGVLEDERGAVEETPL